MHTILRSVILAILCSNAFGVEPIRHSSNDVGQKIIVYGVLDAPLGKALTITGEKRRLGLHDDVFWVDTIDGKKAKSGMNVLVPGIEKWPDGKKAKLYGYEQGEFILSNKNHDDVELELQRLLLSFKIVRIISSDNPAAPTTK